MHLQILALVADNAENNSTMTRALERLLPNFKGEEGRIRCFAHILNLVVKVSRLIQLYLHNSNLKAGHSFAVCPRRGQRQSGRCNRRR